MYGRSCIHDWGLILRIHLPTKAFALNVYVPFQLAQILTLIQQMTPIAWPGHLMPVSETVCFLN